MTTIQQVRGGLRPGAVDDRGFSIVEMIVTVMISAIVLAICGSFFANVAQLTSASKTARDATGQAVLALDAIGTVVRVASDNPTSSTNIEPAVVAGTATSLTITAWTHVDETNPAPSRVVFTLGADGYLTQTTTAGVGVNGYFAFNGAVTSRTVAGPFETTGAAPFFSYTDMNGALLFLSGGKLANSQRPNVTFISVTATVAHKNSAGLDDPVVVTSAIGMPNLARDVQSSTSIQQVPIPAPAPVPTPVPSPTPTPVPVPVPAPSATQTPSPSPVATPTPTSTPVVTPTPTGSGTPKPTQTPKPAPAPKPAPKPAPTSTPTPTPTPTATPTPTPTPIAGNPT